MMNDYGYGGYGMYWNLIEVLYEQSGNKIEKFPKMFEGLAMEMTFDAKNSDLVKKFINACINDYCLLSEDEKYIWSNAVLKRMEVFDNKRLAKSESGKLGGIMSGISRQNEAKRSGASSNEAKESKVKEIKEKKVVPNPTSFLTSLKENASYSHIDIDNEIGKMDAWLLAHKGRQKTKRFIVNWLNKIEKPLSIAKPLQKPVYKAPDEKERFKFVPEVNALLKTLAEKKSV
jgi:hypothetical protein